MKRPDAIARLDEDQQSLERLFEAYVALPSDAPAEKAALLEQVGLELRVHAQVAQEVFYPALASMPLADGDEIEQSQVELALALDLLGQIDGLASDAAARDAAVQLLSILWQRHAGRERNSLFAAARQLRADTALLLGRRIVQRSDALMKDRAARLGRSRPEDEGADPVGRPIAPTLH